MSTLRPWRSPFLALCAAIVTVTLALALSWRCGTIVRQGEDGAWRGVRFLPPTISLSSSSASSPPPTPLRRRPTFSLHPLPPLLPAEAAAAFDPRLAAAAATAAAAGPSSSTADSTADSLALSSSAALPRLQDALRGALITAVAGGTPAILSFAASPSSSSSAADNSASAASAEEDPSTHLEPYLRSLALVGGPELASTAVVACADEAAAAACEAAREATADAGGGEARCVRWAPESSSSTSSSSPSWAPIQLVAEAVGAGFAVIYAAPQSRFAADPRFALRRLAEGRLAEVAVGTKAASPERAAGAAAAAAAGGRRRGLAVVETSWDPSLIAARSSPGARALLAAWLASSSSSSKGGEKETLSSPPSVLIDPASRLAEAAAAATAAAPSGSSLELAALPAAAWASPAGCKEGDSFAKGVVRTIAAAGGGGGCR